MQLSRDGCKLDLRDEQQISLSKLAARLRPALSAVCYVVIHTNDINAIIFTFG
jgi:hypothetical protein